MFLFSLTEREGQLLGLVLMASGAAGYMGGRRKSSTAVQLQLVGCLVGVLLGFGLINEVVRDRQVDCSLAELYYRGQATQEALASVQQHEAMAVLYARLDQLEDSMGSVQQAAVHATEMQAAQQSLKATDTAYIRHKVSTVKKHAQELLDSVLKNPDVTPERIGRLNEDEKAVLRARMEVADKVLELIKRHEASSEGGLSFEEYQQVLQLLSEADASKAAHPEIAAAKQELPNMKAALERSRVDAYHTLQVGDAPAKLQRIQRERAAQRERFNAQFQQHLAKQAAKQGGSDLEQLPAHCLTETAGEKLLVWSGLVAIALQLAGAYVALSLTLRLPTSAKSL
ncbi:cell wall anchor [Chlorella sorokiniana]|uniref:Cell wall anchor n=1 Tax=Chlorella sorokiniana TaxID=3076 RepID=A0A2P6TWR5_CHLSO|nr:cell wall anchor [Chlorella sorokiniana]|eukprot:PRW58504.1 cell wall anchor [Chlorella sorokiniana]